MVVEPEKANISEQEYRLGWSDGLDAGYARGVEERRQIFRKKRYVELVAFLVLTTAWIAYDSPRTWKDAGIALGLGPILGFVLFYLSYIFRIPFFLMFDERQRHDYQTHRLRRFGEEGEGPYVRMTEEDRFLPPSKRQ